LFFLPIKKTLESPRRESVVHLEMGDFTVAQSIPVFDWGFVTPPAAIPKKAFGARVAIGQFFPPASLGRRFLASRAFWFIVHSSKLLPPPFGVYLFNSFIT